MEYEITNKTREIDNYFKRFYKKVYIKDGWNHQVDNFINFKGSNMFCFSSRENGELITCQAMVEFKPKFFYFSYVAIHEDYRNQGLFNTIRYDLLDYLINTRKAVYLEAIYLISNADRYMKIGFKKNINRDINKYYAYTSNINLKRWW